MTVRDPRSTTGPTPRRRRPGRGRRRDAARRRRVAAGRALLGVRRGACCGLHDSQRGRRRPSPRATRGAAPPGGARAAAADRRLAGLSRPPLAADRGRAGAAARDGDAGGVGAGAAATRRPAAGRSSIDVGHRLRLHRVRARARARRRPGPGASTSRRARPRWSRATTSRALGLGGRVTRGRRPTSSTAARPRSRADLIVSNPPYLPSELHARRCRRRCRARARVWPSTAGRDGLAVIRRLVDGRAAGGCVPGGVLVLETAGDRAGAGRASTLMRTAGLDAHRDAPATWPGSNASWRDVPRDFTSGGALMPARLLIEGGVPLQGEVAASAAKNAALPALAAALLTARRR